jgi:hypothetical protein
MAVADTLTLTIGAGGEPKTARAAEEDCTERIPQAPTQTTAPSAQEPASDGPAEIFRAKLVWQAAAWLTALMCLGIVLVAISQLLHPPRSKSTQTGIYGVMGLFSIGVFAAAYVGYRLAGQKFAVFADRLVAWQHFQPTTFRWDQIREVYRAAHRGGWSRYRVVTRLGQELTFGSETTNYQRLGDLISVHVAALTLPGALRELEAGRDVRLGPLRICGEGVIMDGELEPWQRIGLLTLVLNPRPKPGTTLISNMLHVQIGDTLVEVGAIPNYRLFEELALRLVHGRVGARS